MSVRSLKYTLVITFLLILFLKPAFANDLTIKLWDINDRNEERIEPTTIKIQKKDYTPLNIMKRLFSGEKYQPEILIVKNETAYVNIKKNPEIITNQSGSSGASHFQAKVVFNLTEFNNIKYVYFVDEGEHFASGKYERLSYWYLMDQRMKMGYKKEIEKRLNPKSSKTAYYIYILTEIGDGESIKALEKLKDNFKKLGYTCISIDIDKAVNAIRKRIGKK